MASWQGPRQLARTDQGHGPRARTKQTGSLARPVPYGQWQWQRAGPASRASEQGPGPVAGPRAGLVFPREGHFLRRGADSDAVPGHMAREIARGRARIGFCNGLAGLAPHRQAGTVDSGMVSSQGVLRRTLSGSCLAGGSPGPQGTWTPWSRARTPWSRARTPWSRARTPWSRARTPWSLPHEGSSYEGVPSLCFCGSVAP